MGKLNLIASPGHMMPMQALVDAVNDCRACGGHGNQPYQGHPNIVTPCPFCTLIRKALKPFTEEKK